MGEAMPEAASNGPLSGLRVLEIGHFVAAPFCLVVHRSGLDPLRMERIRMCCGVGTEVVSVLVLRARCLV